MTKRILITGKNSYIGNALENCLLSDSDQYVIYQVDLKKEPLDKIKFEQYSTVFHVAGIAHQKETEENKELYYAVNRDLAISVAKQAKYSGVKKFIFMSSMSVYGKDSGVIDENTEISPSSYYGKSKREAELLLKNLEDDNFKVAIVRPPMVYGKNCRGNYPKLSNFVEKYKVFPNINNQRSMIYIGNLVSSIKLIIDYNLSGEFFPQNESFIATTNLAKVIGRVNNYNIKVIPNVLNIYGILSKFNNTINKIVGNLVYDQNMSIIYSEEGKELTYNNVNFEESIKETERE